MSAETAIETELLRQYAAHQEWDEAKEVIEGLDCAALAEAAIAALRAQNAELRAALKLIARQTEPRLDMPKVALAICSAVNKIALAAAP